MDTKQLLEKLYTKMDLTSKEIKILLTSCINGDLNEIQLAAFLMGLRLKGETVEEINGLIHVMRKHMIAFPEFEDAIDTCGTGGDGAGTFNISTAVSFVVAGAGVPVIKHGNKAASSQCGSADVLSELGVEVMLEPKDAQRVFEKVGMIFLFAPLYHPAMKHIAPVRKALGTRTVFNFLGPFLNPARVKRQLIGVPNIVIAEKLAKVATHLHYKHLLIVTSSSGLDEIDITGETELFEIKGHKITRQQLDPQKLGFKKVSVDAIKGGRVKENAKIISEILSGVNGAKRDIVVLNSAYVLLVAGKVTSVTEGIALANESIDNGAAKKVLGNLIRETQKYAK